jgi:hypothetical protein
MMLDTEAAVMANLDFLSNADVDMEDDDDMSDDVDIEPTDELDDDVKVVKRKGNLHRFCPVPFVYDFIFFVRKTGQFR